MATREFEVERGAMLRIEAQPGDRLRVRFGDVWVTQHEDSKDYVLKTGASLILSGKGVTLAMAYQPTVLELHRCEPPAQARRRLQFFFRRPEGFSP